MVYPPVNDLINHTLILYINNLFLFPEKVLYARNSTRGNVGSRVPVSGGTPITEQLAIVNKLL